MIDLLINLNRNDIFKSFQAGKWAIFPCIWGYLSLYNFKKIVSFLFCIFLVDFFFSYVLLYFVMFFPTMPFSRRLFLAFCWYSIQSTPRAFLLVIIFGQWFLLDFYIDESNDSFISSFHCLFVLFFCILNSFTHSPVQCWLASVIVGVLILILLWKCF